MPLENIGQLLIIFLLIFLPAFEGIFSDLGIIIPLIFIFPLSIILAKKRIAKDNIFWTFLLFLIFCFISIFFSIGLGRSIKSLFLYFFYFLSFFIVRDVIKNKKFFSKILLIVILATSISLSLFSFYYLIFHKEPPFGSMNLVYASFGHNHLVDYLIFALPITFCLFLSAKTKKESLGWAILTLFFILNFIFSFSRAGIGFSVLTLGLSGFFIKTKQKRFFLWLLFFILFVTLFIFLIAFYLKPSYFSFARGTIFFDKIVRPITLTNRIGYWQQAWQAFLSNPIFGTGLDTFRLSSVKYQKAPGRWSWFVHNHFLQLFSETGIFSGAAFLFLIVLILLKSFKVVKDLNKPLFTGFFIGILVSALHSLVDYDWQFVPIFLNFWVISGLLLSFEKKKQHLKSKLFYVFLICFSFIVSLFGLFMGASEILFLKSLQISEKGFQDKGLQYLIISSKIFPFHLQRIQGAAKYFYKLKETSSALWFGKKSLDLEKANWETHKLMGDINLSAAERKEALEYYQKAISLNPLETADLYLKSAEIYLEIGDKEKEKEILLKFFEETKDVDDFGSTTDQAIEIFMSLIKNSANKDFELLFEVFERTESLNNKHGFDCFDWSKKMEILELLRRFEDFPSNKFENLSEDQKAKYYFWLSTLVVYREKNWPRVIELLKESVSLDPKTKHYSEFLEDVVLIFTASRAYYNDNFEEAKDYFEQMIKKIQDIDLDEISDFERSYYSRTFDFQARVYQKLSAYNWEKMIELDSNNENGYLQLAKYYLDWQEDRDGAKTILDECLREVEDPKNCQDMLSEQFSSTSSR